MPGSSDGPDDPQELSFQLEVIVRKGQIEVGDRTVGALGVYPRNEDGEYDFAAVSRKLAELKQSYPEKLEAAILLESDIPYEILVKIMDRVRIMETIEEDQIVRSELFPVISIGDAPVQDTCA